MVSTESSQPDTVHFMHQHTFHLLQFQKIILKAETSKHREAATMSWLAALAPRDTKKDVLQFSDKVNSRYTVVILVALSVALAFPQLIFEEPITCSPPDSFTEEDSHFANKVV